MKICHFATNFEGFFEIFDEIDNCEKTLKITTANALNCSALQSI